MLPPVVPGTPSPTHSAAGRFLLGLVALLALVVVLRSGRSLLGSGRSPAASAGHVIRPGDSLLDPRWLDVATVESLPATSLPSELADRVRRPVWRRSEELDPDSWLGPDKINDQPYLSIPFAPELRQWKASVVFRPGAGNEPFRFLVAGKPVEMKPVDQLTSIPDPYFCWDAPRRTLFAFASQRPADVQVEYPMDVAAELGDYESRALRPPPDAPGSTRAADLMRRTTIGGVTSTSLLLPAPSCVSFAIDELGGNDLSFQVGVADAQFACNGDVVERVHGKSDGVLFAVEVLCDGVKKRVWQQLVGRDSVGTGLAQASVGLEPWRGKRVELRLVTEPGPSGDAAFDYATWSGLRIYGPTTRKPPTPHLVLIDVDTLRADRVGVCGAKLPTTPRIDAWAKREAAIYRDVLSTASWTLPATASIFTGMYVNQHGVDAFPKSISSETPTLATMLRQEGYETYAIAAGGYVVDALGFSAGFDRFAIDGSKVPNWTAALDWLARRRSEHPAFLFLHTYAVHAPYGHEDRFGDPDHPYTGPLAGKDVDYVNVIDPFNNGNLKLDAQDRAYVERQYSSLVRGVDDVVGSLLERLAAIFGDEDYMVVFTSDHGEEFFEHGRLGHGASIYQELLRVPLLVRYPKSTPNRPLGVFDTPASCVDLVPTVLTALGLPVPAGLPGVPLQADVDDRPPRLHYFTVADRGVTFGGHALLRHLDGDDVSCQLYSLRDDPTEQHDLLAGKEPPPNLRDLRARMEARLDHLLASYPPVKAGTGTRLDAEQLKRLKDLGYTVDGTKESAGSK